MNASMGNLARTTKIVSQRYNRVPFSAARLTHEFLGIEGRKDSSRAFGEEKR
jgi:hypothetical protein